MATSNYEFAWASIGLVIGGMVADTIWPEATILGALVGHTVGHWLSWGQ